MSLNKQDKQELRNLLASIKIDEVTTFPISYIQNIPFAYINSEVFFQTSKKNFSFTIEEAIQASEQTQTVITLKNNGMHYYYTPTSSKNMLWIPNAYETIKETKGSVVVMQEFPSDGKCSTKYLEIDKSDDSSLDEYRDKDVVLFNNANFYLERESVEYLAKVANRLWQEDMIKNRISLTTLQNY